MNWALLEETDSCCRSPSSLLCLCSVDRLTNKYKSTIIMSVELGNQQSAAAGEQVAAIFSYVYKLWVFNFIYCGMYQKTLQQQQHYYKSNLETLWCYAASFMYLMVLSTVFIGSVDCVCQLKILSNINTGQTWIANKCLDIGWVG